MATILSHPADEACAAVVMRALPESVKATVLIVSVDALADGALVDAAPEAHRRGTLILFLWRNCLVDMIDRAHLYRDRNDWGDVRRKPGAPLMYPRSGAWVGRDGDLMPAIREMTEDLTREDSPWT